MNALLVFGNTLLGAITKVAHCSRPTNNVVLRNLCDVIGQWRELECDDMSSHIVLSSLFQRIDIS